MTVIHLIRHGAHELQGRVLVGRMPGVRLSRDGRAQAEAVAERLADAPIAAVYSSPLDRARDTATPLARRLGIEVESSEAMNEIDFGDWTGQPFEALAGLARWQRFNAFRSGTTPPGGESMAAVQARMVAAIAAAAERHPGGQTAFVSHGDVIKGALAYYLGVPLDLFHRIEVDPGTLSAVEIGEYGPCILRINALP